MWGHGKTVSAWNSFRGDYCGGMVRMITWDS